MCYRFFYRLLLLVFDTVFAARGAAAAGAAAGFLLRFGAAALAAAAFGASFRTALAAGLACALAPLERPPEPLPGLPPLLALALISWRCSVAGPGLSMDFFSPLRLPPPFGLAGASSPASSASVTRRRSILRVSRSTRATCTVRRSVSW